MKKIKKLQKNDFHGAAISCFTHCEPEDSVSQLHIGTAQPYYELCMGALWIIAPFR